MPEGICFGLLGPNGAGKTTTIEIMEGILEPTAGEVLYRGEPVGRRFREEAGILFQKTALQDFLTLRQSLTLFRGLYSRGLDVDEVLRLCALEKLQERDARKLSGGQQQRLLLAIALSTIPRCCFSMSRPPDSTRRRGAISGSWCNRSRRAARRSSSPRTTWRKPSCCAMRSRSWIAARSSRRARHGPCCASISRKCFWSCRGSSCRRPRASCRCG